MRRLSFIFLLASGFGALAADDPLDLVDQALTKSFFDDRLRLRVSGLVDLEYYNFPQPPPGLIRADHHDLVTPRLSLFLDAKAGPAVYFFLQTRIDSGFDPNDLGGVQWRLDEYALRITPWRDGRFNLQRGKFTTVIGGWVERHLSWDNPLINAPVPYEAPTLVSDLEVPLTAQSFRAVPGRDKYEFLPIIWGPVYAVGASVAGKIGLFEYAAEIKSVGVSSRPESWYDYDFGAPAIGMKLSFNPNEAWHFGISGAENTYLRPNAAPLSPGDNPDSFRQYLIGQEISYARGHLQIWAEAFQSRFEIPRLGEADVFAYYLELKYKFTPQLFGAMRWNQEFFDSGTDPAGESIAHAHKVSRVDLAFGYRFTAHTLLKLQYSIAKGDFVSDDTKGTFADQFTVRF